ncbi:predicted protein [Uncinocarpus reesii 1704]|uniref:Peroxin 11C n=1 Tax=Uncinocarpus reesii (strain UAMH 1704) TaxID=336963 RepID=C4JUV5_UNCRE|nr:uncharacterized protein UREG_04908 [Uncinocarpus reesii 1704]EEP80066.1 predicted protein [Uncinocarpus reesii 1704]
MEDTVSTLDPSEGVAQPVAPKTNGPTKKPPSDPDVQSNAQGNPLMKGVLSKTDTTILRLSRQVQRFLLISTSYGEETVLASVNYSASLLHYILFSPPLRAIFARLHSRLGLVARTRKGDSQSQTPPLLALAALISETRTALRLLGLIPLWEWGSATVKSPPADPVLRGVAFAQVFVNVVYQFMENIAFLASKGIVSQRLLRRWGGVGKWYIWSTRAWLSHVVLEFVRLWRERCLAAKQKQLAVEKATGAIAADEEERGEALRVRAWRKSLVSNLAWFPLCLHWSLENGAGISNSMVGLLGFIAGAWKLSDSWKATATG